MRDKAYEAITQPGRFGVIFMPRFTLSGLCFPALGSPKTNKITLTKRG